MQVAPTSSYVFAYCSCNREALGLSSVLCYTAVPGLHWNDVRFVHWLASDTTAATRQPLSDQALTDPIPGRRHPEWAATGKRVRVETERVALLSTPTSP